MLTTGHLRFERLVLRRSAPAVDCGLSAVDRAKRAALAPSSYLCSMFRADTATEKKIQGVALEDLLKESTLVVHNDEVNTFDWVIKALMEICHHSREQAEQSALIIHYKGKHGVRAGSREELKPMREAITDRGIQATIE